MTERELFLSALEIEDEAAREAWLQDVCAGEAGLLARVASLLASLKTDLDFLETPILEQLGKSTGAQDVATVFMGANSTVDQVAVSSGALTGILEDAEFERPGTGSNEISLDYLEPSTKPFSLGRLGHYEIHEILGHGAFGTVFRAFDERLQRVVAIKVLVPELAATTAARKRFLREAQATAAVRHEHVVSIYAVEEAPLPFIVMEYVPGTTLQKRVEERGPLSLIEVVEVGTQIAEGLAAAHAQGLIHRDIKPGNILLELGARDRIKITDFGLARAADDASLTRAGTIAGTPMFMAPEQARGEKLDQRSDLFSFGSVLYHVVTGQPPFRGGSTLAVLRRVTEETARPIQEIVPATPDWLCQIISRLQEKNPDERYQSADDVAALLARCRDEIKHHGLDHPIVGIAAATTSGPSGARRRGGYRGRIAATIALVGLLGLSLAEGGGFTNLQSTIIRLFSREGTLVIDVDDPDVSVTLDEDHLVIKGAGIKEIRLDPGRHMVQATKDGKLLQQKIVSIEKNGRKVVKISTEPSSAQPASIKESVSDETAEWERSVEGFFGTERAMAVAERLKKLNPRFDGRLKPTIEDGVVRGLDLCTHHISDISPLRVLGKLKNLDLHGDLDGDLDKHGDLVDLSPLQGLSLVTLRCICSPVRDLSPLRGMPLTSINFERTTVTDLAPLEGMPLSSINFFMCAVADLAPLKGMRLTNLMAIGSRVCDLAPLEGMPLRHLFLAGTPVSDLTPLRGMPLKILWIGSTKVTTLAPLAGLPLEHLGCDNTQVSDLSPIVGMSLTALSCQKTRITDFTPVAKLPLREVHLDFVGARDADIFRGIPTLESINSTPAAEFLTDAPGKK